MVKLIVFFVLVSLSAFFSAAETAFTAINRLRLKGMVHRNVAGSFRLQHILQNPKRLITALLIGNSLTNIAASAIATAAMLEALYAAGIENYALTMSIITGILTFILLVFGEISPKTIAIKNPERFALLMTKPVYFTLIVFSPLIKFFSIIDRIISKLLMVSSSDAEKLLTAEELKAMLKVGASEGVLEKREREMLHSVFDFSEKIVREIMTPRTDAVCIDVNRSIAEVVELVLREGHSRIPVFEEKIDNIIGIIYAKDLLTVKKEDHKGNLRKFMREAVYVPETKNIEDLLHQMKKAKFHLAIIVDEYGGFSGIATMEDIIEEIFGEIWDEYDLESQAEFSELSADRFLVDGGMNIDDLAEKLEVKFPTDEDYDTIGGFVLSHLGKFPKKGERIKYKGLEILIKEVSKRRIIQLEIVRTTSEVLLEKDD